MRARLAVLLPGVLTQDAFAGKPSRQLVGSRLMTERTSNKIAYGKFMVTGFAEKSRIAKPR